MFNLFSSSFLVDLNNLLPAVLIALELMVKVPSCICWPSHCAYLVLELWECIDPLPELPRSGAEFFAHNSSEAIIPAGLRRWESVVRLLQLGNSSVARSVVGSFLHYFYLLRCHYLMVFSGTLVTPPSIFLELPLPLTMLESRPFTIFPALSWSPWLSYDEVIAPKDPVRKQ